MDLSLLALVGVVVVLAAALFLRKGGNKEDDAKAQAWRGAGGQTIDPQLRNRHGIQNGTSKEWGLAEVARHNKADDLFMVVQNKVYDLTDFADDHPGGIQSLMRLAGQDNTEGFSGIQHPAKVWDMIQDYYIGDVKKDEHVVYTFKSVSKL